MRRRLASWRWQGLNKQGLRVSGIAFLPPPALRMQLWQQEIQLIRVRHQSQGSLSKTQRRRWQQQFTHDWLALLKAGIPQLDALHILQRQAAHAQQHQYLSQLISSLQAGHDLATSLQNCSAEFSQQYCRLVAVGEQSGQLPQVLQRLEAQFIATEAQRKKLRKAISYPLLVLAVSLLVFIAMLYLVVPQFASLYQQLQVAVPNSTQRLLDIASWLRQPHSALFFIPLLFGWPVWLILRRLSQQHTRVIRLLYQIPLLGKHLRQSRLLQDISTLCLAYRSSIPLTEACMLTAQSSNDACFAQLWRACARLLGQGSSLHEALQQDQLVDAAYIQNLALGEQSGRLQQQLDFVIQHLQQQLDDAHARLMAMLEPAFLLFTGAMTAALLMALYLPLFQLGQLVS
ncbi:hypothetical protein CWE09_07870 [Aliidiomarina minuta]|uniref:Type II secretion system protein GspF domain-containing protein n=1 Tax=Aliidiomarina minuta TaxID=880057 RepID=A0A432W8Y3_9GAMM|nr:type II secretion system F family protein [Aliidiomarina minuta]RUO26610.1 hypothetical protein CWE09_07870 [Aliidiomarina minuta]